MVSTMHLICIAVLLLTVLAGRRDSDYEFLEREINKARAKLKADPSDGHTWGQLGMYLQAKDVKYHEDSASMQPEALSCFDKAIELSDNVAVQLQIRHRKGMLLKMMSRGEEAVEQHEWVYHHATSPVDKASSLYNKGHALGMLGRIDEAVAAYRAAIETDKNQFGSYLALTELLLEKSVGEDILKPLYEEMENTVAKFLKSGKVASSVPSVLNEETKGITSPIFWALFMVGDRLKDHERAWKYLEIAHKLEKASRPAPASEAEAIQQAEGVKAIFRKGFWPDPATSGVGVKSKVPVFIVGMMRSGSTLTETMLDAHSQIWGMGEDSVFNAMLGALRDDIVAASYGKEVTDTDATAKVVKEYGDKIVDKMLSLAKNYTNAISSSDYSSKTKTSIMRVVDKMLFNYRNIGFIHLVFPNAVIIHTMRDPMDTLFSCFKHKFDDGGLEWALDAEQLALQYYLYLDLMDHFRKALPGRVVDVLYEELIQDPKRIMKRVLKEIGVKWEDAILNFHETKRIVHTHSMTQVRQSLSNKAVGGWRKYAKQLTPVITAMKRYITRLKTRGPLPYYDKINWELNPHWSRYDTIAPAVSPASTAYQGKAVVGYDVLVLNKPITKSATSKSSKKRALLEEEEEEERTAAKRSSKSKKSKKPKKKSSKKPKKPKKSKANKKQKQTKTKSTEKVSQTTKALFPKKTLAQLEALRKRYIASYPSNAQERIRALAKSFGSVGAGNDLIDDLTAIGYILVNGRQFSDATSLLTTLIEAEEAEKRPGSVAAYMALGTALAQSQNFLESIKCFTKAIKLPNGKTFSDAYARRGEVYSAMGGHEDQALRDLDRALELAKDDSQMAGTYVSRGIIWHTRQVYTKALPNFQRALELQPDDPRTWTWLGKTLKEFADTNAAVAAQDKSLELQPIGNKEAYLEKAIALLEVSRWEEATELLYKVLEIDRNSKMAWGYLGLMYISMGRHTDALTNFDSTLKVDPRDTTVMQMAGICLIGEARFKQAVEMFNRALKIARGHIVWYSREIAFTLWMHLDLPVVSYYPDRTINPLVLEHLSQQTDWHELYSIGYSPLHSTRLAKQLMASVDVEDVNNGVSGSFVMTPQAKDVLDSTIHLAKWIQLTSPGFLPNLRQHKMFGVAALQMAQMLRYHCYRLNRVGRGVIVSDAMSSHRRYPDDFSYLRATEPDYYKHYQDIEGDASTATIVQDTWQSPDNLDDPSTVKDYKQRMQQETGSFPPKYYHQFYWRDLMDCIVRWRQLSEPRDLVLWIDRLPLAQNGNRLGLSTHLLSGVFKNHRYYPYHDMGVRVVRDVLLQQGYFMNNAYLEHIVPVTNKQKTHIREAKSVEDLYNAVGGIGISILAPCNSVRYPGKVLNGTRIIADKYDKEGWDLTISTPSTTERYTHFEDELDYVLEQMIIPSLREFLRLRELEKKHGSLSAEERQALDTHKEKVIEGGLIFFFYWVHFAPLSRGTSATGYAVMVAFILSVEETILDAVPERKQLDFEGMFRADPYEFVRAVRPWISNRSKTNISEAYLNNEPGHRLSDIFSTSRAMMSIFVAQPGEEAYNKKYTF